MDVAVIGAFLVAIIAIYFWNNPLRHSGAFMWRRFVNWLPLGMTYAFLYMGRYNLTVAANAVGLSNSDYSWIGGLGTLVYGCSFVINGPLVDRIGGRKGMLIAGFGTAAANLLMGFYTVHAHGRLPSSAVGVYSVLYGLNSYFQSYGAVSIIKVKAYWFHVRERGVFGAIFGTLISFGVYFAFDWGHSIVAHFPLNPAMVFYIPAAIIAGWTVIDIWAVKDAPHQAGFKDFDTADASSGHMDEEYSIGDLLRKVFCSPLMMMIAMVELTSGVFRNGILYWYTRFVSQTHQTGAEYYTNHFGFLACIFGVIAGLTAGFVSDKLFQSRRAPPAGYASVLVLILSLVMFASLHSSPVVVAWCSIVIIMGATAITSLMSGTAATDMGGRKATATCAGIVDGFAYLGSSVQAFGIGHLSSLDWKWWPLFFVPFAILGMAICVRMWWELPPATKRFIAEVELKDAAPVQIPA